MIESGVPRHTGEDSLTVQLPRFGVFTRKREFCKQQVSCREPAKNLHAARANLRSMSLLLAAP
jgi:hypothetical protein